MTNENLQRAFFVGLLLAVTVAFLWLIRSFLQPIFWAAALGIVFYPAHEYLSRLAPRRATLTAAVSVVLVLLVVILPIALLVVAVTNEATALYQRLNEGDINLGALYQLIEQNRPELTERLRLIGIDLERLPEQLSSIAGTVSRFLATQALAIGQDTLRIAVYFFIMLYLLFFFLRDGGRLLEGLVHALPFGDDRERHLLERFAQVSRATIKGTLVVGIVQGAIGGIAFSLIGIGAPVLWGVVMAVMSIIPAVGPAVVWVPAAIYLGFIDRYIAAVILVLIGTLVIGLVDNLLRPLLVGRDTKMPDYLILLSTLGGLTAFGLAGFVLGPIIAAFFLSVWEMAAEEFADLEAVTLVDSDAE
jgi:predicted PurR-regulated permease PerM